MNNRTHSDREFGDATVKQGDRPKKKERRSTTAGENNPRLKDTGLAHIHID